MKKFMLLGMAAGLTCLSLSASAEIKPFEAIEYRQGIFKAFKWNFGPMADMVRGKAEFDADQFIKHADKLNQLSHQPWDGFVAGTYDSKTAALPKVESDPKAFQAKIVAFEQAVAKLNEAAQSKDLKQIRPAFGQAGQSCKSCHDSFKD